MSAVKKTNVEQAIDCWSGNPPAWVVALATACDQTSQVKVSGQVNYSGSVISQVIRNKYVHKGGDLKGIEKAVEGALMGATVECPVIGEIPRNRCNDHQRRGSSVATTNPMRIQLYRACPSCVHRKKHGGEQ